MDGKKHIIIITHYAGLYGANVSMLEYLSNTSLPLSNFLLIIPTEGVIEERLKILGIKYIIYPFRFNTSDTPIKYSEIRPRLRKFKMLKGLQAILKPYNPALIYSNSSVIYYGFFLAKMFGVKHIWHLREFGKEDYELNHDFGLRLFKLALRVNDANICISQTIKSYYKLKSSKRSHLIYNGIATAKQISEIKEKQFSDVLTFGVIGVVKAYKQILETIKAFHQYLSAQKANDVLLIIGLRIEDSYNQSIDDYIAANNLSQNIIFKGHISSRDDIYNSLDLLIHGAKYEAFGRVTAEAMSYGVVPVGFNYGGTTEIIQNNVNGYLFNDFDDLSVVLQNIKRNQAQLSTIQNHLKDNFNKEFTVEVNAAKIDAVIMKLSNKLV